MKLNSSPKIYNNYKCDYPENTIKKIEEGFKKIGLKLTYKEKSVSSPDASIYSGYALIDVLSSTQNGKGTSSILSKASAYAETAERFSTGFLLIRIPLPKKSSRYRKLLNDVTERSFLRGFINNSGPESTTFENINKYFHKKISKKQYEIFKKEHLFDVLVDAYSLIQDRYVKVPIHFIELKSTSNGISSGNTYEEAIAQAAFEIFERHAVNKIVFEKIVCPTISPNSIKNDKIQNYLKMFESLNIEVIMKDFTLNNIIPVIGALFINHNLENDKNRLKKDRYYKRINVGSHCNLYEAIIRCFAEYLQNINKEELIDRKQSDVLYYAWTKTLGKKYSGVDEEFKHFTRQYDYYGDLSFLEKGIIISFDELKCSINNDSLDDVKIVINICRKNNWNLLIVDYTHKILQFPAVRVIISPLSTDYDIFTGKCLKIETFEERFNYFYGIRDFHQYLKDSSWIKDKNRIKKLIENIENYLSKELAFYQFYLTRENSFHQLVNLFHILSFLYLTLGQHKEAKKYFGVLMQSGFHPPIESSFFNSLYQTKYNPIIYQNYINTIDKSLENNSLLDFELKFNPFDPDRCDENSENMYCLLLDKINQSFK